MTTTFNHLSKFLLLSGLIWIGYVNAAGNPPLDNRIIRLATTTSVENSGLLAYILPRFTADNDYQIVPIVVGSGKALSLGRIGEVDLVWVHSPQSEKQFVSDGYGTYHHRIMRNDFVLAGPSSDPVNIAGSKNIYVALEKLAETQYPFISRGDDSGTNKKERFLWKQINIDPFGHDWYVESGAGMSKSLTMAEQNNAYILIDRATFEVRHDKKSKVILEDPLNLFNPYSVIAVKPNKGIQVNLSGAKAMIDWLASPLGQQSIAKFKANGRQLYLPVKNTFWSDKPQ